MSGAVLEFDHVTLRPEVYHDMGLKNCSFTLWQGDLMLVLVKKGLRHSPLSAAAVGLIEVAEGRVLFCGEDWSSLSPHRLAELRSKVGRVYAENGWISNLDVDENMMLAEYHHTRRSRDDILNEALEIARRLGLSEIPQGKVVGVKRTTLRLLEWVRGLLGEKVLLILEHPMDRVPAQYLERLMAEIARARERGMAFIWITDDTEEWKRVQSVATASYEMDEHCWKRSGEKSHA